MTSSGPLSFGYVHIFKHTADLRRFLCVLMWGWSSYLWKCTIIGGESPSSSTSVWHQAFDPVPGLPVSKWFKSPSWTGWIISCYIILYYIILYYIILYYIAFITGLNTTLHLRQLESEMQIQVHPLCWLCLLVTFS
jgi:hypothetical protein